MTLKVNYLGKFLNSSSKNIAFFLKKETKINELAIKYADQALEKSALYVPYAGWTAGLASWRLKRYKDAAKYFSNFSISSADKFSH